MNKNKNSEKEENIHKVFQHYRTTASILSATIITLSLAVLGTLFNSQKIDLSIIPKWIYLAFEVSVIGSIFIQYFIFHGYYIRSNELVGQYKCCKSDCLFTLADRAAFITVIVFLTGFLGISIILFNGIK